LIEGMSDFSAILQFIGSIVAWVLNRTIDLICLCLLLISCVLPWRIIENCRSDKNFRELSFEAFCLTIFDLITLPAAIIACTSYLQWPAIFRAGRDYADDEIW
jgi:uncharacterized membrane protein